MQKGDKVVLHGRDFEVVKQENALVQITPEGGEEFDYFWVRAGDLKPMMPATPVFAGIDLVATEERQAPPPDKRKSRIVASPATTYAAFAPWLSAEDYKLFVQVRSENEASALAQYASWSGESVPEDCIARRQNDTTAGWQHTQQWVLQFPYNSAVPYPFPIVESGCGGGLRLGLPAGILSKKGNTITVSFVAIIASLVRAGLRARR